MSGLVKPVTQRGRPGASRRTRNPAINIHAATSGGGVICGSRNDSFFISSYHDDKQRKRKQQMIVRIKKLVWGVLGGFIVMLIIVTSRSSSTSDNNYDAAAALLRNGVIKPDDATTIAQSPPVNAEVVKPTIPPAKPIPNVSSIPVTNQGAATIEKNPDKSSICGRKINIDLFDPNTWPTPGNGQRSHAQGEPSNLKHNEAVLLKRDDEMFGGLGCQLNAIFHAYDFAESTQRPLIITQDSWILNTLYPFFFGPSNAVEKNSKLWKVIQETLQVKVVENEGVLRLSNIQVPEYKNQKLLYYTNTNRVNAETRRNRRDTILRQLFQYPSYLGGSQSVCSVIGELVESDTSKYSVVHFAPIGIENYLSKLNGNTGKDLTDACSMKPEYVKNVLKQTNMLDQPIFPIDSDSKNVDLEKHKLLETDSELANQLKYVDGNQWERPTAGYVYLAVLADVYIGNPVDQLSLWIARMRYALGIKNTFVLTEKQGDNWVSYVNDDTYLELYDANRLGTPWIA